MLGIDPGTRKCGYAVSGAAERPLELGIVLIDDLAEIVRETVKRFDVSAIALGRGTHSGEVKNALAGIETPIVLVDERNTTYLARARYFADFPPRGLKRLLPIGLLLPPRPIDDYAALIIAERYRVSVDAAAARGAEPSAAKRQE